MTGNLKFFLAESGIICIKIFSKCLAACLYVAMGSYVATYPKLDVSAFRTVLIDRRSYFQQIDCTFVASYKKLHISTVHIEETQQEFTSPPCKTNKLIPEIAIQKECNLPTIMFQVLYSSFRGGKWI